MERKSLIPEVVNDFIPDEVEVEAPPRSKAKTIPELKEECKELGLKVSGTRQELVDRIEAEVKRIEDGKQRDKEAANLDLINNLKAQIGAQQGKLVEIRQERHRLGQKEDELEASVNQLKLTLSTLEQTLELPDEEW
tara:strand:- start:508 stop:918 length:411 start_codon:yes stop_codon:yes gene_type:complete